jgi:hypothetical protein
VLSAHCRFCSPGTNSDGDSHAPKCARLLSMPVSRAMSLWQALTTRRELLRRLIWASDAGTVLFSKARACGGLRRWLRTS